MAHVNTKLRTAGLFIAFATSLTTPVIAGPDFTPIPNKVFKPKTDPGLVLNRDLEVSSITMVPQNPVAGKNVMFTFKVTNKGAVKTPKAETLATFWDTKGGSDWGQFSVATPEIPELQPGQEFTFQTHVTFITLGDSAGVVLKVDRFNKISETDETNNEKRHFFSVTCKPELSPYDYRKPIPNPAIIPTLPNQEVTHNIAVYNNGWCQSQATTMSVGCDEKWPTTIQIPPINGHQKIELPITLKWDTAGMKSCKVKVDEPNTISESIETNNEGEFKVSVAPNAWPKP